jgi:hypothetical protein
MHKKINHARRCCAKIQTGAENTTKQAFKPHDSRLLSRPKFGNAGFFRIHDYGQDGQNGNVWRSTCFEFSHPAHPRYLKNGASGFQVQQGTRTMTTPTRATMRTTQPHGTIEAALRAILSEVTPGQRPFSGDSYLPVHLVDAARAALAGTDQAARQHAHNALSTAAWHVARGEAPQALSRLRRAQSHLMASMEGGAA